MAGGALRRLAGDECLRGVTGLLAVTVNRPSDQEGAIQLAERIRAAATAGKGERHEVQDHC